MLNVRRCFLELRPWALERVYAPWQRRTLAISSQAKLNPPDSRIRLRDYQEECIQSVLSHLERGRKRLGVSLATGSGKTVIFTHLIDRVRSSTNQATQTLILAHRRELVEQAARHCFNACPSKTVDIEMGKLQASGVADITVASIQSLCSGDRLAKFQPERFKLVLVDEAHHIVAPGYRNILSHFGLLNPTDSSPALIGVSATFSRFDGLKLGAAIDHIVYHKDYVEMIEDKWLTNVIFTTVQSKADISGVKKGASGDFQAGDLSRAVNTDQSNEITVRAWLARAENRKSTLVFCADIAHVVGLTHIFRRHGVDARYITGETAKIERGKMLDQFKAGAFPVLLNCGVFTEGTDIPNIDCIVLARPTRSRNLLVQMIGRGMRLHPDKENCHVIDMVASLETGIVTSPTLFGLDPSEIVSDADVNTMKDLGTRSKGGEEEESLLQGTDRAVAETKSSAPFRGSVTFTDYDSVVDLIKDTSGERRIRAVSPHAWVQVGPEKYVLTVNNGTHLTLEKVGGGFFQVRVTLKLPGRDPFTKGGSPFARPRQIAQAETFLDAVHAADTYAAERFVRVLIAKDQAWRKAPASEGQLQFLNKFRSRDDLLTAERMTKGKAMDMITKLRHGARSWFDKIQLDKKREQRKHLQAERAQAVKQREVVTVGPLSA